ncbi:putative leader peptide [Rhodococcus sp. NPDC003348]
MTTDAVDLIGGQWCRRHVDLCRTASGMCPV